MVNERSAIDIEAFETFDPERLLRVLRRAIREEAAGRGECDRQREADRAPSRVFRNLVSMIQEMMDRGLESRPPRGRTNGS